MLFRLPDPLQIKPMVRRIRVAVEPQLFVRIGQRSGDRLVDEALRHERYLVEEHASQCDALNQRVAALVLAAEQVKVILTVAAAHRENHLR